MGCVEGIGFDEFRKQGENLGKRVRVCFYFDTSRILLGTVVRHDTTASNDDRTIILLDDGRYVLSTECQYQPIGLPPTEGA